MAAIFLDVDALRSVNYHRGHLAGDEVLKHLGTWLAQEAELLHGRAFRVAGDEFIVLLPGRTLDEAAAIATRLVSSPHADNAVTLSAVVFQADPELPGRLRAALDEFAEMLYRAELDNGRAHSNVVVD